MNPLVSVVVTSYNHAEFLEQRMQSLLSQTYKEIEINVVDDCSCDSSVSVLKKYEKYPNVHITVLNKNGGYANACNLGVQLSRGDFIMFAECDDYCEPTQIECLIGKLILNPGAGVAYCRSNMVDANGKIFGTDFQYREKAFQKIASQDVLIPQKAIQRFFLDSCVIPNMSAALIRRKYFDLVDGFSLQFKVCADWDFWCRIARHCDFYYVSASLNNFRNHSTTVRNKTKISNSIMETYEVLYREFERMNLSLPELLKFKYSMGVIWSQYIMPNPIIWIKSGVYIWQKTLKYDFFLFFFMFLSLIKKIITFYCKKMLSIMQCINHNYARLSFYSGLII